MMNFFSFFILLSFPLFSSSIYDEHLFLEENESSISSHAPLLSSTDPENTMSTISESTHVPFVSENLNQLYQEVSKEEIKEKTSPTVVEEDEEFEEVILEDDFTLW